MRDLHFERGNVNRKKKFKTCEGDSIFLIGPWRPIHEIIIPNTSSYYEFAETYEDGMVETRDSERVLRYFLFDNKMYPLTEFGIIGTDYDVQIISFINKKKMYFGHKTVNEIHFINGYCMSEGMEWMLIEIDKEKNRVRIFECDPKCRW